MNEENDPIRDPDYQLTDSVKHQKKIREDLENKQMINKIKTVIRREFQKELETREKQLELIQQRLTKAAKSLHLLRYCLITSYYNKNEFQVSSSNEDVPFIDKQSRIHPAVKRLLGNNSEHIYSNLGLRKKKHREFIVKEEIKNTTDIKIEKPLNIEVKNEPKKEEIETLSNVNLIRNRKLYKHQIVIGNISKWAPSESPEDSSTHKWMVYIRGPKEYPDISHIIQKVIFNLHPSYKPNDVIEVMKSPFHLSRRGWGEFPLRVQLFFHGELNKPVDVIHNLKLDRTRTGRQTLGNETIIELSLYDMNKGDMKIRKLNGICEKTNPEEIQENKGEIIIKEEVPEELSANDESKTIQIEIKKESLSEWDLTTYIDFEHNYCQKNSVETENSANSNEISKEINVVQPINGGLIGNKNKRKLPVLTLNPLFNKRIKTEFFEDPENVDMERYEINLDLYKLKNLDQTLIVLFKKLPLVNEVAQYGNYKWMYPFTASSVAEFTNWNVAKQFSSEWARSQLIRKLVQSAFKIPSITTKNILKFGRAHGFTFPLTYDVYPTFNQKILDYSQFKTDYEWKNLSFEEETHIDIIGNSSNKPKREEGILIKWTDNFKDERSFVKQTALDVGVLLKQDQIIPGVLYSTSERIIYECVKSFAEDLIRRSLCWAVTNEKFDNDSLLTPSHIIKGLHHRKEFKKLLSFNKDTFRY
ncbi:uncharacterized protein [Onthophagus taurus]|uniref:uncharacterized protein n=1 Tax=Onthophagus taurus TaxID=166361 RepID=UPI0039BDFA1C